MSPGSGERRAALVSAMRERRPQLTAEILDRVYGIGDQRGAPAGEYAEGLQGTVRAAIDYGYQVLEADAEAKPPTVPPELLRQARLAARSKVGLDLVLRRYFAGHTLFSDLLLEEAGGVGVPRVELKRTFRFLAASVDRVLSAVGAEYLREFGECSRAQEREGVLIEGLLAGELLDATELRYDFDSWHLGLVARRRSAGMIRSIAVELDRAALIVTRGIDAVWVWLGGRREFDLDEQQLLVEKLRTATESPVAIGEPGKGLSGWRLTHRQAMVTMPIARGSETLVAQYAHAPLLASALSDDLLARSLREIYLAPLMAGRDKGAALMPTLRAYFAAGGNASSAAAALGVGRHTVSSRLAAIEELLGRPIDSASAELETALRLAEIEEL